MQGMQGLFQIEDWPGINSSPPAPSTDSAILNNAIQSNIIATPADIEAAIAAKIADNTIANQADITAAMTPVDITDTLTWRSEYYWQMKRARQVGKRISIFGVIKFTSLPANTLARFPAGGNLPIEEYFVTSDGTYAPIISNIPPCLTEWNTGFCHYSNGSNTYIKNGKALMINGGDVLSIITPAGLDSLSHYFMFNLTLTAS
jgi:hypothetical protein